MLVANAGISIRKPFLEIEEADWRRVLDVNLTGVFHCAQQAARRMVAGDGGVILMTASTNGLTGHPFYADYNASKAGVILLARTMALELAPTVRVNAVCPGYVLTPMQQAEYTPTRCSREVNAGDPARPPCDAPRRSPRSSRSSRATTARYFTGAVISIDGGETAVGCAAARPLRYFAGGRCAVVEPDRAGDAGAAEPAVAVRVLREVLLVVRLRVVERARPRRSRS